MPAAVTFYEVVLALHIAAVVVAFGAIFAHPILIAVVSRGDSRALAALHRAELAVEQRLIMPGLTVVLLAGIYLASKLEVWDTFYVQWGLGVTIVLGGLSGLLSVPTQRRLTQLAERDAAAAGDGEANMSAEYQVLARRLSMVGALSSLLVLLTIYFMTTRTGA